MAKSADVRFYVDADILGLGKLLADVRNDVTYPGFVGGDRKYGRTRLPCPITSTAVPDQVWIPETAARGWLIITRDSAIQESAAEIAAVRDSGARMVALVGKDAATTWEQLRVVMRRWDRIEACLRESGPFIYAMGKTSFRRVDLG
jgi:hypothetical protein